MEKKTSTADFKFKSVMESFQRDTTLEATCQKFGVSRSQLTRWRQEFQENGAGLFADKQNPAQKAVSQGYKPGESPDDLKKIIGELTVQNEALKSSGVIGTLKPAQKVELAHQLKRLPAFPRVPIGSCSCSHFSDSFAASRCFSETNAGTVVRFVVRC